MVIVARLSLAPLGRFGFTVRLSHRSIDGAARGGKPVREANPGQNGMRMELLVEPLPAEQAHSNAERDLEAQGAVGTNGFPVLLQGLGPDAAGSSTLRAMVQLA